MPPKAARRHSVPRKARGRCCSAWPRTLGAQGGARDALVQALMAAHWDEADDSLQSPPADSAAPRPGLGRPDAAAGARRWNGAAGCGPRHARRTACSVCWPAAAATRGACASAFASLLTAWESETDEPEVDTVAGDLDEAAAPQAAPQAEPADARAG